MSEEKDKIKQQPPAIGPYFFPVMLGLLGLWCVYDGWVNTAPDMAKYKTFNQIMSIVFLGWTIYDVTSIMKTKKKGAKK